MKDQEPVIDPALGYVDASHIEREKYHLNMDMCEVHRTELFREYPFQVWLDEAYVPEQLNFYQMAFDGWKMRWRKEKLCICEYLPDSQTREERLVKRNPMGFAMMHNQNMLIHQGLKRRFKDAAQMIARCSYASYLDYLKSSNNKAFTALAFHIGMLLGIRRRMRYAKMND